MNGIPINSYRAGTITFPNPGAERNQKWYKDYCVAALRVWGSGAGSTGVNWISEVDELRSYAAGNQSIEKYQEEISPKNQATGTRRVFGNISWDNVGVLPKIVDAAVNNILSMGYDPSSVALDENAVDERLAEKWRAMAKTMVKPHRESLGLDQSNVPDNLAQVDMLMSAGGIKLAREIAADMLVKKAFMDGRYDAKVDPKVVRDLVVTDMGATRAVIDEATREVIPQYVDVKYLIIPFSNDPTYSDVPFIGHIEFLSPQEFYKQALAGGLMNETRVVDIIKKYVRDGSSMNDLSQRFSQNPIEAYYSMNSVIPVLKIEIKDFEMSQMVERTRDDGSSVAIKENYNPKAKSNEKRKFHHAKRLVVREAAMVLGEDELIYFGDMKDMAMKEGKPCFSYSVYKAGSKSKVSHCIPLVDQFQKAVLRERLAQANANPDGHAFDLDAMMNVHMGGEDWDPWDLMMMFRQTGNTVFRRTDQRGNLTQTSLPVVPIQGGTGKFGSEQIEIMSRNLNMMLEVTGVNEFMSASQTGQSTPVATMRQMMEASSKILMTHINANKTIKEQLSTLIVKRYQSLAVSKEIKVFDNSVGIGVTELMIVSKDFSLCDMGIYMIARPTESQISLIMDAAIRSVQQRKAGGIGITVGDMMFIERQLASGNIKLAQVVLAQREQDASDKHDQMMQQNQQMSQMAGAELEKQKRETVSLQEQARTQRDEAKETIKGEYALKNTKEKIKGDLRLQAKNLETKNN